MSISHLYFCTMKMATVLNILPYSQRSYLVSGSRCLCVFITSSSIAKWLRVISRNLSIPPQNPNLHAVQSPGVHSLCQLKIISLRFEELVEVLAGLRWASGKR